MKFNAAQFESEVTPLRAFVLDHCIRVLRTTSDNREMRLLSSEFDLTDEEILFIQVKLH